MTQAKHRIGPCIERIEAKAIAVPLGDGFAGSVYKVTHRTAVITRIHAEGLVGEAVNMIGEKELLPQIVRIIHSELAPALESAPADSPEVCWQIMDPTTRRGGRDVRGGIRAVGAVDSALWDLFGKLLGQPLYRLWGGYRSRVPIVAIGGYHGADPGAIAAEIDELKSLGLGGLKFKVGMDPEGDAYRLHSAYAAAGDGFTLFADANRAWTVSQAMDFARRVQDVPLRWFEEPCLWRNARFDDRKVGLLSGLPICAGQSELAAEGPRQRIEEGSVDVCNFDASWSSGPTEWRRIAGMAALYGVEMAHHGEPHLGVHLLGSIAHGTFAETHHPDRDPLFHEFMTSRCEIADGHAILPDEPGWGIELDHERLDAFRIDG